ncbi:MAG: restriction endonuclease subunit S [Zoogloeaceae bacterium]|jgi:type I restriction enzyme S subunit|nr:restriction endonuclease subunit S [Zoogloeaceae bacterium]
MKLVNVGDICRFEYGKSLSEKYRQPGDVVVYGSNGPVGRHSKSFTDGPTIIIGRKGSIGAVHVSANSCWPIDTTYFIDKSCTDCNLEWLAFYLQHLRLDELNKASGVPGLNRDDAYKQQLWLPETENEQRQIAARLKAQLAEVETARQAAQAQLRDADLLRTRLLRKTFDALRDVPRKRLGECATTTSGSTPPRGDKRYWSPAEIPWVKTGEVAFVPIAKTEESISRQALAECSLTLLPPRTVLIAMYGQGKTRGQSAILEIEATTNQACFAILPNDTWDADFLHYWLMASYEHLRGLSDGRGGNQANLNAGLLNDLKIPAPDINEQRRIAARLKSQLAETGALRAALIAQRDEIERLPSRLLAQVFESKAATS